MANKKKDKKKIPQLKKDIKDFLIKEEGNIVKKDVVKVGMSLLMLGVGLKAGMEADEAKALLCDKCMFPNPPGCPY